MAKQKNAFICGECGYQSIKWLGRCPECGTWNSMTEQSNVLSVSSDITLTTLSEVKNESRERIDCGIGEMNRALGGGLMMGSTSLIGGEPGIGKSTLIMQIADKSGLITAYVSGEETAQQIKLRSDRLKVKGKNITLICDTHLGPIINALEKIKPTLIIIDSIQTLVDGEAGSQPGSINQLKSCSLAISRWAKLNNSALILIAHVTKEGTIAGPKILEHMVDAVLYFDGGSYDARFLRSVKNRFGPTDEVGLFTMGEKGLEEIRDPRFFLEKRKQNPPPGIAFVPTFEGSRVFMVEIQALVAPAKGSFSRIYSDKIENNRVSRIAAVLEKHISIDFSDKDLYVNVAGGIKISETACDLALAAALYSARTDKALPSSWAFCGEISLAGEIRHIGKSDRRIKTAEELGFTHIIGPECQENVRNISYMSVENIKEFISLLAKGIKD